MRVNDFRPIGELANRNGVKAVITGKPGTGKTPLLLTAPRAAGMITEPGLLSIRGATSVMAITRYTKAEIDDYFKWLTGSNERRNFDTHFIDSVSQWAEIELKHQLSTNNHGLKAYGEMARNVVEKLEKLYFLPEAHVILIAKLDVVDLGAEGIVQRPYFPGKELHIRVPHMFDEILQLDYYDVPGYGRNRALRCQPSYGTVCRDRSGKLNEFEPPDLTALINKAMS